MVSACSIIVKEDIAKIHEFIMQQKKITTDEKATASIICAKYESMLNNGVGESIVLSAFLSELLLKKTVGRR